MDIIVTRMSQLIQTSLAGRLHSDKVLVLSTGVIRDKGQAVIDQAWLQLNFLWSVKFKPVFKADSNHVNR